MIVARRILIGGRVQGVGFRFFAEQQAAVEGVHGWVRNVRGGQVEAFIEGDVESVDRVEAALRRGPPGAVIESFEIHEELPIGRPIGFSIRS